MAHDPYQEMRMARTPSGIVIVVGDAGLNAAAVSSTHVSHGTAVHAPLAIETGVVSFRTVVG